MARTTLVILLLWLSGCQSMRLISICRIDTPRASCARNNKNFQREYPEEMVGWVAWDEEANQLLGSRLEQCESDGKLPPNDRTLDQMRMCAIGANCGSDLVGYWATDPEGRNKIKDKLEWCRR